MRKYFVAFFIVLLTAAAYGQSKPGLFTNATKAKLTVNLILPREQGDSSPACPVSRDRIEREARAVLVKSPIVLTDVGHDITIIAEVELYKFDIDDEPVDNCTAKVSVRSGITAEINLPYKKSTTKKWLDLFHLAETVSGPSKISEESVYDAVNRVMKRFLRTWANDQKG